LQARDEKTKFFHRFVNHRKASNSNWSIERRDGTKATSFLEIVEEGTTHFKALFKADSKATIDSIIQIVGLFPSFIDQEGNEKLMA
jgi:hypothetical protein